jgi:hypothetical protein
MARMFCVNEKRRQDAGLLPETITQNMSFNVKNNSQY